MNYEKIKHEVGLDSRRVSTGVLCRIIRDDSAFTGLLSMLKMAGYWPQHVIEIPLVYGIDPATGVCIVMPMNMVPFFKGEWRSLVKSIDESFNDEEGRVNAATGKARRKRITEEFLKNIQEHLIIGNIDPMECGTTVPLTGSRYDVYIKTREQNEPGATLVRKAASDTDEPNVFDTRENPTVRRWTDSQKRKDSG